MDIGKPEIKMVTVADLSVIQAISHQTFKETFAPMNTVEDMHTYLTENLSTGALQNEISNSDSRFYLVINQKQTMGYFKLNFGLTHAGKRDKSAMEIERIYLLKEFHGTKTGQYMLDEAIQIARQNSIHNIWLGVWEHNQRAISFYEKNGFTSFGKQGFQLGNDKQMDILMTLQLQ